MREVLRKTAEKRKYQIPERYISGGDGFPTAGMDLLRSMAFLSLNIPSEHGGKGLGHTSGNIEILRALKKIGSYDLSLGRIYEGHLNALLLLERFGTQEQKNDYFRQALSGTLFGIWNSEFPSEPLRYRSNGNRVILEGSKVFCSGANHVHRPIVTATGADGTKMVILEMDKYGLKQDMTYWRPMGMKSSVSCRFDFTGIEVSKSQVLGNAYDYVAEPDFTSGAARFAAVQLGGAEAAIAATVRHLQKMDRTGAPEQIKRLGKLAILRETGTIWTDRAGEALDRRYACPSEAMYQANMFRTLTRELCEEVLKICEMSVGLQGLMAPHPLERIHRDLSVYLKQPGPDRTITAIGERFLKSYQ